jgi:hypothetical protein
MRVVIVALVGLLAFAVAGGGAGCVRASESVVREKAAAAFSCAEYALDVEEIGPEEYRASGCGRELIYACHRPLRGGTSSPSAGEPAQEGELGNAGDEPTECSRRP